MMKGIKIAFDGPAASGKSTVAKEVAKRLSYLYVDTGAMYRAVTWKALCLGADFRDEEAIIAIAGQFPVELKPSTDNAQGYVVIIDGVNVTDFLTSDEVNLYVSTVARISGVRKTLVAEQRALAREGGVVMAGRDITTVVMPDAEVKVYLTASSQERARRRFLEMEEKGENPAMEAVVNNIEHRDTIDSSREDSPLSVADEATVIDSTGKSIEEVVHQVMELVRTERG
ncbi:MAG: (d)CMP kinase [Candidatus Eremiobacteraeota bacterium]|nr:(d)CMP kinase [Candidatus Eremiobacteraeota bacterium]